MRFGRVHVASEVHRRRQLLLCINSVKLFCSFGLTPFDTAIYTNPPGPSKTFELTQYLRGVLTSYVGSNPCPTHTHTHTYLH
jgi:hypothetical protein